MRVCVYGSGSAATPLAYMDASRELGRAIALAGHECINGGGKTGCMGAVTEACKEHGGRVVGVIHEMWVVDGEESTLLDELIIVSGEGLAERKAVLLDNCDCILVLPGGCGTWDELWQSVAEVGLGFRDLPIVCVNTNGFYTPFYDILDRANKECMIYKRPESILRFEDTPGGALKAAEEMFREVQARKAATPADAKPSLKKRAGAETASKNETGVAKQGFLAGMVVGAAVGGVLAMCFLQSRR
ncbi:hypothetical protein T484DRAFT_1666480 [Baffinella frigidus]|nr:hypothetical protein T484DRAFT_1666480 [Cryptophyta sp. CCMP2293]